MLLFGEGNNLDLGSRTAGIAAWVEIQIKTWPTD